MFHLMTEAARSHHALSTQRCQARMPSVPASLKTTLIPAKQVRNGAHLFTQESN